MSDDKKESKIIVSNNDNNKSSEYDLSIKEIQDKLKMYQSPFKSIIDNYNKSIIPVVTSDSYLNKIRLATSSLNTIAPKITNYVNQNMEYINTMINAMNISSIVSEYVDKYQKMMKEVLKTIKLLPTSRLSGVDSTLLNKYYWVVPFEYEYVKVEKLSKYKTRVKFENYMIKYFNDNRTKRLFKRLRKQFKEIDKKELLKQIENSYFNGDYAICITSLMTLFDGSTLILLEPNSGNQHSSYKVIDEILKYINDRPLDEFGYELYLKVDILNNFIDTLYKNVINLRGSRRKLLLSRHINSHGVRYLNNKINVLRLLNALYFCNEVIEETNLKEQFTKNGKYFSKI